LPHYRLRQRPVKIGVAVTAFWLRFNYCDGPGGKLKQRHVGPFTSSLDASRHRADTAMSAEITELSGTPEDRMTHSEHLENLRDIVRYPRRGLKGAKRPVGDICPVCGKDHGQLFVRRLNIERSIISCADCVLRWYPETVVRGAHGQLCPDDRLWNEHQPGR